MKNKHQFMGSEKITKLLIQFSLPAIIGMLVNALYSIVDRIYIGNIKDVGHFAIAGVGLTFPVTIFVFAFAVLIGLGGATNISLNLGKKQKDEAEHYLGNAICFGTIVSTIIGILVLIFMEGLVDKLGGSENTSKYTIEYLRIVAIGFPATIVGYVANAGIRSDGNPKMSMVTLLIGAIINIVLDPIFIFGMDMGVSGAAWATIISQYISAAWTIYYFKSKFSGLKLYMKDLPLKWERIKNIMALGSAPFALQLGSSLVNYTFNHTLKIYGGDNSIGAMAIIQAIVIFLAMPIFGINQGLQPILGYNYGAKLYARVREALRKAILGASVICIFNFLVIQFLSKYFIFIFTREKALLDIASFGLRINTIMFPIIGFQIISSVYFQAVGKPKLSLFISLSRQIIILIPCIIVMSRLFGLTGIWFAAPTSDFISTVITFILIKREMKTLKHLQKEQEEMEKLEAVVEEN
ncbi:MATE family efflux transporter [Fusobacterium sp.]|uniref:MATE family efflux transporter n=1 Tax=Fusobacterium sp. TaxID=68766 RepID=UPI001D87C78E|nr:MATE family efflux transporter [Fusobacterium sp.]MBS5789087.1 MATE family efflux transporter [Fusobacterium sp.]